MNVMVIEDEVDILNGIIDILSNLRNRFQSIQGFERAEDALKVIVSQNPDILITDILLPEMSGLEMLEQIRQLNVNCKIIVVSSYSNFQYAQKSVQLGAIDYILKPFNNREFCEKIVSILDILEEEARERQEIEDQRGYAKAGVKSLKEKFILSLCTLKMPLYEHIFHRLQLWNMTWLTSHSFHLICFDEKERNHRSLSEFQLDLRNFAIGNIAEEVAAQYQPTILFHNLHNQWIIITVSTNTVELIKEIQQKVHDFQRHEIICGVSKMMTSFQSISTAYDQALKAFKVAAIKGKESVIHYSDIDRDVVSIKELQSSIALYILDGNEEEVNVSIDEALNRFMLSEEVQDSKELSRKCFDWLITIYAEVREVLQLNIEYSSVTIWSELENCHTIDELRRLLAKYVNELMQVKSKDVISNHFLIKKAKKIMKEISVESITLQSISGQLQIHPVWLSQLFKRETGQNFSDYVIDLRIEKAKDLLRNSNDKIYEISSKIGYQDLQYFGTVFKKRTGVTPKEYRNDK